MKFDGNHPDRPTEPNHPSRRSGHIGSEDDRVAGWYGALRRQLMSLEPYLAAGHIVTFQNLAPEEKTFYEGIVHTIHVPKSVCAVFIPPSIVQQAMWPGGGSQEPSESSGLYRISPDAGAIAAQRCGASDIIVNALFSLPPFIPGIDVYEDGRLLAGYTFKDHQGCADSLSEILKTYLS